VSHERGAAGGGGNGVEGGNVEGGGVIEVPRMPDVKLLHPTVLHKHLPGVFLFLSLSFSVCFCFCFCFKISWLEVLFVWGLLTVTLVCLRSFPSPSPSSSSFSRQVMEEVDKVCYWTLDLLARLGL
jgi:hypothetical protein